MSILSVHDLQGISAYSNTIRVPSGHNLETNGKLDVNGTLKVPVWTIATRPTSPEVGLIGYNTSNTVSALEIYDGNEWVAVGTSSTRDPYWSNVRLLVRDGSLTDLSGRHTITTSGSATTIASVPPWKGSGNSWSLGQNSTSYLNYADNLGDFALGANTVWTVEFWAYLSSVSAYPHYFVPGGQQAQGTFKAYWEGTSYRPYMYSSAGLMVGASTNSNILSSSNPQWVWMVYQRDGSSLRIWINGSLYETSTNGGSIPTAIPSADTVRSGAWSGESVPFYIDELRVTIGTARYGTSASIPIQDTTWPTR